MVRTGKTVGDYGYWKPDPNEQVWSQAVKMEVAFEKGMTFAIRDNGGKSYIYGRITKSYPLTVDIDGTFICRICWAIPLRIIASFCCFDNWFS